MAEFSKQYDQIWGLGLVDFDIEQIASKLEPDYYKGYICEGFGFTAIGKDKDNKIILYFPNWNNGGETGEWKDYSLVMEQERQKASNFTE